MSAKTSIAVTITLGILASSAALFADSRSPASAESADFPVELGGEGTVFARGADAFSHPARNSGRKHRRSFVIGNALFKENWVATPSSVKSRQGLGPLLNAQSCSTCHFKDGRGQPPLNPSDSFSSMLIRLSVPGRGLHGEPKDVPSYGDQFNHRAIVGVRSEGDVKVRFETVDGKYPDETAYALAKPAYAFEALRFGALPSDVMISARVAPQVIGLGLLEAIDEKAILAHADPEDRDGDGISGRPNRVWDMASKSKRLGRFGWKANQPSIAQQNAGAFLGDMGITSKHFPKQNCAESAEDCRNSPASEGVELSDSDRDHMDAYVKLLAVPARRDAGDSRAKAGLARFREAKCQSCHVEAYRTGRDPKFPELSNQVIHPFTDLLLHDMGDGLADHRPDYEATGSEWRTPPLWGIGLFRETNGHTRYLHDGRARSLEEAILWHGGEAEASKKAFMSLKKPDRDSLIRFLETL